MSAFKMTLHLLLLSYVNLVSCGNPATTKTDSPGVRNVNSVGYDLSRPDRTVSLPPVLLEVSGITVIDSTSVACVQDENGIVFIFDMVKNEIRDQFIFHYAGDFEGITRVASTFYILRSDGTLFEARNQASSGNLQQIIESGGPPAEYEGLCYDNLNHRLLIVPKNNPRQDSGDKKRHPVYGLDLKSGKYTEEPVLEFDLTEINRYAAENKIEVPDDKKKIVLKVAAIGIHPITKMLYVISGPDRMLFVFDEDGRINYIEKLDKDLFNMPEGISFHENGDMLISNEGRTNPPTILLFKYTPE